jgi:hypothetical protein
VLSSRGIDVDFRNYIRVDREAYISAAVFDESVSDDELRFSGIYADVFTPDFNIITDKTLKPGENALLLDLKKYDDTVIGTSVRINSADIGEDSAEFSIGGASGFTAYIRLRLPFVPSSAVLDGEKINCEYESVGKTTLVSFESSGADKTLRVFR